MSVVTAGYACCLPTTPPAPDATPPPCRLSALAALPYPCLGARSVFRRDAVTSVVLEDLNTIYVSTGSALYSNRSRVLADVVDDTVGVHDLTLTPCSQATFDILYPDLGGAPHPSCYANLVGALEPHGVDPDRIGVTLNVFMDVWTDEAGELHIDPPPTRPGDRFTIEARVPLLAGVTACSAEKSNNGRCTPVDYLVERA